MTETALSRRLTSLAARARPGLVHGDTMKLKSSLMTLAALAFVLCAPARAQTEIQWWHAMSGPLGDWVNDLARQFNESQKEFRVVPTYKGTYDESMTAAIAAFR